MIGDARVQVSIDLAGGTSVSVADTNTTDGKDDLARLLDGVVAWARRCVDLPPSREAELAALRDRVDAFDGYAREVLLLAEALQFDNCGECAACDLHAMTVAVLDADKEA